MSLYSAKKNNAVEWKGTLSNLPVAVDTFKPIVDHYFLSHAHSDHHFGLKNNYFSKNSTKRIYCTHYTKILICAKYTGLEDYITTLNVNEEKTITVGSTVLHVTPLNANHCAGSVMFLFESKCGTILYTGDIRFEHDYYEHELHDMFAFLSQKKIERIFLDATFCDPFFETLPTRVRDFFLFTQKRQSIDAILSFLKEKTGPIYLAFDMLGTEPLLVSIAKTFDTKLFIDKELIATNRYREMTSLDFLKPYLTTQRDSRFNIIGFKALQELSEIVKDDQDKPIMLRATTMWLKKDYENSVGVANMKTFFTKPKEIENGIFQFIFSIHNSLSELLQFVKHVGNKIPITPLSQNTASIGKGVDVHKFFVNRTTPPSSPTVFESSFSCLKDMKTFRYSYDDYEEPLVVKEFTHEEQEEEEIVLSLGEEDPVETSPLKRAREDEHEREKKRMKETVIKED